MATPVAEAAVAAEAGVQAPARAAARQAVKEVMAVSNMRENTTGTERWQATATVRAVPATRVTPETVAIVFRQRGRLDR